MNGVAMAIFSLYLLVIFVLLPSVACGDELVQGSYCYSYGDKESLKEAREITRTLAIREAIESSWVHIKSSSKVEDSQLTDDLIQSISSGTLKSLQVMEHTEKDRTICEKIQANVNGKEIVEMIQKVKMEVEKASLNRNDKNIEFGKWRMTALNDNFAFYTEKDVKKAPAKLKKLMFPPAPFPDRNHMHWIFEKNLEMPVDKIDSRLEQYSVRVTNVGYAILSLSKRIISNIEFDVIEVGCKIEIENKTRRGINTYGGCYLFDGDSFQLTGSDIVDFDQDESGIHIPAKTKGTVRRTSYWVVDSNAMPYPTTRIRKVDYKLFLRHDIFESFD